MPLTKVHRLMLFTLGSWYSEAEKKLNGRPLELAIPKSEFIRALKNAGITGKGERALYQNLENIEKKRLISYDHKALKLTYLGKKNYQKILKEVNPYLSVLHELGKKSPLSYTRQAQTRIVKQ